MQEVVKEIVKSSKLDGLINRWIYKQNSPKTKKSYEYWLTNFIEFLTIYKLDLLTSDVNDLADACLIWYKLKVCWVGELDYSTQRLKLAVVASFCKFARLLPITSQIDPPQVQRHATSKEADKTAVKRGLDLFDRGSELGARYYTIFLILAFSGKRISEVLKLRLVDVDVVNHCITFYYGKGRKILKETLPDYVMEVVEEWLIWRGDINSIWLFPSVENIQEPFLYVTVYRIAGRYFRFTKLHSFRHLAAMEMYRRGASVPEIQRFLGHTLEETTRRYIEEMSRGTTVNEYLDAGLAELITKE